MAHIVRAGWTCFARAGSLVPRFLLPKDSENLAKHRKSYKKACFVGFDWLRPHETVHLIENSHLIVGMQCIRSDGSRYLAYIHEALWGHRIGIEFQQTTAALKTGTVRNRNEIQLRQGKKYKHDHSTKFRQGRTNCSKLGHKKLGNSDGEPTRASTKNGRITHPGT